MGTVGAVSNPDNQNTNLGKAGRNRWLGKRPLTRGVAKNPVDHPRSEEHTSELQSLMRISYAVFCLKKKTKKHQSEPSSKILILYYILHYKNKPKTQQTQP